MFDDTEIATIQHQKKTELTGYIECWEKTAPIDSRCDSVHEFLQQGNLAEQTRAATIDAGLEVLAKPESYSRVAKHSVSDLYSAFRSPVAEAGFIDRNDYCLRMTTLAAGVFLPPLLAESPNAAAEVFTKFTDTILRPVFRKVVGIEGTPDSDQRPDDGSNTNPLVYRYVLLAPVLCSVSAFVKLDSLPKSAAKKIISALDRLRLLGPVSPCLDLQVGVLAALLRCDDQKQTLLAQSIAIMESREDPAYGKILRVLKSAMQC